MFKKEIFKKYKELGLTNNDISAELSMIYDYLEINPVNEFKSGLSQAEIEKIIKIVNKRCHTQKPLQQILGFGYFMGEKFFVNNNTLIPRPETEILVKHCANLISKNSKVLDIGTGTGCIAIELNKLTNAECDAVDISKKALSVAKKNNKYHNTACRFFYSDLFSNVKKKYDLIVSNPPYIPKNAVSSVNTDVLRFEPHLALFTNDSFGIEFYKRIINDSFTFLNNNGYLAFELGINQYSLVKEYLEEKGFLNIQIFKDLDNIERIIISKKFT